MVDAFEAVLEEARRQVPLEPVPEPSVIENWSEIEHVLPVVPPVADVSSSANQSHQVLAWMRIFDAVRSKAPWFNGTW